MKTLPLVDAYTSTGSKLFWHREAMDGLREGRGQPITTHVMLTDVCNHKCAFCSVQRRAGDSLALDDVMAYVDTLIRYDLKSVILSGGGNPILYKCKTTGKGFNQVVDELYVRGLDVGLITNGMPLTDHRTWDISLKTFVERKSWVTVVPATLDKLKWVRISMSGLDHPEGEVCVPDLDRERTALGFSYVAHDRYEEPADHHHGAVSRKLDLISGDRGRAPDLAFEDRMPELTKQIAAIAKRHQPRYVRLLPNCLEPERIPERCAQLEGMAAAINFRVGRECAFVQRKPPRAPQACYLGYVHPVLNCDGWVYPCDSCVLNESADHQFANPWRVCRWDEVAQLYDRPVRSLIDDPAVRCPGCVFSTTNGILGKVVSGGPSPAPLLEPEHANFP